MLVLLVLAGTCILTPFSVSAEVDLSGLNTIQQYFTRVIGSLARKDYYDTDVLGSITLAQGVYESGWARYGLPVGGKNLFGIKAYNTWSGMVFDQNEQMLYESYDAFLVSKGQSYINTVSAWRAYPTWADSVKSHSSLFINESKYASVVGEKDFEKAAYEIVDAGYCSDYGYAATVVSLIKKYGFTEYDDLTPDDDGVVGIISKKEQVWLSSDQTHTVELEVYPAEAVPSSVSWKSDDESVATVDENGCVTAVSHGMTLITATLQNGREACCIVYVDCNATVIESDVYVRTSAASSASSNGKFYRGTPILVTDDSLVTDSDGNSYLKAKGFNSKGDLVSGYVLSEYVYRNIRGVSSIRTVWDSVVLKKGTQYTPTVYVSPVDATDTTLTWSTDDPSVATVENGAVTAVKNGTATVTARSESGAELRITVTVSDAQSQQRALVSSHETVTVRSEPSSASSSVGRIPFLSEVTVIGEPVGVWVKVKGTSTSGKTITGYSHSAYIRLISDTAKVSRATADAGGDIKVYEKTDTLSQTYGTLAENSTYVSIPTGNGDWCFVIGVKNPGNLKAIYGYAAPGNSAVPDPDNPDSPDLFYGVTTSSLRVRAGKGTNHESLAILSEGTQVIVMGPQTDGWYRVTAADENGEEINGYCSAEYILLIYDAVTTSKLNVRAEPNESADKVGVFDIDSDITVIGADIDGWYRVEGKDYSTKKEITGYSSAKYITIKGLKEADKVHGFGILDGTLDTQSNYLTGVKANTTLSALKSKFSTSIEVLSPDGKTLSDSDLIATGCSVAVYSGSTFVGNLKVVIKGDINGDGKVESSDYIMIKRSFLGTYTIENEYMMAALVSGGVKLSIADYVMVKRSVLGSYVL